VVVLVPIAVGPPAVLVFIPPAMLLAPASFSRRTKFAAFVIGLPAVAPMLLDGLVEFMIGMSHAALATVDVFCLKFGHCGERQSRRQDGC
jgi:hypothetical protein